MNANSNDLNDRDGHLNKDDESAARFNSDAQKHAIEAMEEDEAARVKPASKEKEEDPIDSYGL